MGYRDSFSDDGGTPGWRARNGGYGRVIEARSRNPLRRFWAQPLWKVCAWAVFAALVAPWLWIVCGLLGLTILHRYGIVLGTVALIACLGSTSAMAGPPQRDTTEWCTKAASIGGEVSEPVFRGCIIQEQASYDLAKLYWDDLSPQSQAICVRMFENKTFETTYSILSGCVIQQRSRNSGSDLRMRY